MPDVTRQENRRGCADHASEAAGAEAYYPRRELRCAAEFIERNTEQERPKEASRKADAGIHPYCCTSVPRDGDGEDTRREIGEVTLHDETGDYGQP